MEYRVPRSFPVEYAALGFLIEAPRHGYDLRRDLVEGLGELWHVALSQLYSVLHRLVEEGWAEVEVEPQEDRPSRQMYSVTKDGRRAFWQWACSPVAHPRDLRVVFLAKVYFLRKLRPEEVGSLIDAQKSKLSEALASLEKQGAVASNDAALGAAACSFRVAQMESALRWLEESRSLLETVKEAA
ncbi:MAG: PadR family transcriptional regulator [Candidatus Bipolaricaulota bacterium]|nr:PadR family transcriptional regulator [Candidatus Bipolaricaulota bacterium]